jgi:hypothetical protein
MSSCAIYIASLSCFITPFFLSFRDNCDLFVKHNKTFFSYQFVTYTLKSLNITSLAAQQGFFDMTEEISLPPIAMAPTIEAMKLVKKDVVRDL